MNKIRFHLHDRRGYTLHVKLAMPKLNELQVAIYNDAHPNLYWHRQQFHMPVENEDQQTELLKLIHRAAVERLDPAGRWSYEGYMESELEAVSMAIQAILVHRFLVRIIGHEDYNLRYYDDAPHLVVGDDGTSAWLWQVDTPYWHPLVKLSSMEARALPHNFQVYRSGWGILTHKENDT